MNSFIEDLIGLSLGALLGGLGMVFLLTEWTEYCS